jgi:hypothetical protein
LGADISVSSEPVARAQAGSSPWRANKTARIVWSVLARGETYRAPIAV